MNRLFLVLGLSLFLASCARPTDRGQQYIDGRFVDVLNSTARVNSIQPKDFSLFLKQLEQVETLSPSLTQHHKTVYQSVKAWLEKSGELSTLSDYGIDLKQMSGGDGFGNVLFTGYFSPVIEIRQKADNTFRYPLYKMPNCAQNCPTREEIYKGALEGKGLEIGYSASLIDNFIMEVQGSGFVHYGDETKLEYFAYGGKNGHPYVSLGKVLIDKGEVSREKMSLSAIKQWVEAHDEKQVLALLNENPSYVFFSPKQANPVTGTAGIPLLAGASVAADRLYLPMGSVLLAEVPSLDKEGNWNGKHVMHLLMALDTGGAVKKSHLDLYHGIGEEAGIKAGHRKHFGRVWTFSKNTSTLPQKDKES